MTEKLLLVTTCGTSLLTNLASSEAQVWLKAVANETAVDEARLAPMVAASRAALAEADEAGRRKISAELNGIGAVLDRWKPRQVFHVLIHTDTELGRRTAELVQIALGGHTAFATAGGLRTDHLASFRAALADLTGQLEQVVRPYRDQGWFVVFNLTGGFKSLNGYLQTLGMITADRCVFLFEGAPELMEIPQLPVRLSEEDDLRDHLVAFRRLEVGYPVRAEDARGIPESLLLEDDGLVTTSPLGDLAWARHRAGLLGKALLEPLSAKVRVSGAVRRAFAELEPRRKVQVNEALDQFCAFIDGRRPLTKSRTFKKLLGDPVPGSTYELYVWSDGATGRLFGHYAEDGAFVFDHLGLHL